MKRNLEKAKEKNVGFGLEEGNYWENGAKSTGGALPWGSPALGPDKMGL